LNRPNGIYNAEAHIPIDQAAVSEAMRIHNSTSLVWIDVAHFGLLWASRIVATSPSLVQRLQVQMHILAHSARISYPYKDDRCSCSCRKTCRYRTRQFEGDVDARHQNISRLLHALRSSEQRYCSVTRAHDREYACPSACLYAS
jgi:hypothetical protein